MSRTREEFVAHWKDELASIVLNGYFTTELDSAARYRRMSLDVRRLVEKLGQIHDTEIAGANGQPAPTRKATP